MMAIPVRERVVAVIFGVLFACIALSAPALATSEKDAFEASKQLGGFFAGDAPVEKLVLINALGQELRGRPCFYREAELDRQRHHPNA